MKEEDNIESKGIPADSHAEDEPPPFPGSLHVPKNFTKEKAAGTSAEELDQLKEKAANADKYYDQMLRAQANLENYRKRAIREREDIIRRANEHLLKELILVLDNFELGLQSARENQNKEAILEGMEIIYSQMQSFLKKHGIEIIDAVGQTFDPAVHEAIAHQISDTPAGQIISQVRKGYKLKGHLLRAAAVIVSKGQAS